MFCDESEDFAKILKFGEEREYGSEEARKALRKRLEDMSVSSAARILYPRDLFDAAGDPQVRLARITGSGYHPCGTVPMGASNDPRAATDGRGRVRGVTKLVVVADAKLDAHDSELEYEPADADDRRAVWGMVARGRRLRHRFASLSPATGLRPAERPILPLLRPRRIPARYSLAGCSSYGFASTSTRVSRTALIPSLDRRRDRLLDGEMVPRNERRVGGSHCRRAHIRRNTLSRESAAPRFLPRLRRVRLLGKQRRTSAPLRLARRAAQPPEEDRKVPALRRELVEEPFEESAVPLLFPREPSFARITRPEPPRTGRRSPRAARSARSAPPPPFPQRAGGAPRRGGRRSTAQSAVGSRTHSDRPDRIPS